MKTLRISLLFRHRADDDHFASALPVAAFSVVVALLLVVMGGSKVLLAIDNPDAGMYQALTVLALALLVVPLGTLGAAAAKLSARRRDSRLSSLALLGATQGQIAGVTVIESVTSALLGSLIGTVLYAALVPLVGLVQMGGARLGSGLWLPWQWLPLVWLGIAAIAAGSALVGLRGVLVTPLGVRTRQRPRLAKGRRALVAAALVGGGIAIMASTTSIGESAGFIGLLVGIFVAFGCGVLALDAIGPWYLALNGRIALKRAHDVEALLAARAILDDPLSAWRNVAGLGLATFVSVVGAAGIGLMSLLGNTGRNAGEVQLYRDMSTGVYLTLAIAFVMVAATVAITQAAQTLDRARVQVAMDRLGVPEDLMARSARRSVMLAVVGVMGGAAVFATALMFPIVGVTLLLNPMALVTIAAACGLGILIVRTAASASAHLVPGILARPERVL